MTEPSPGASFESPDTPAVQLRGVRVHNLKNIQLNLPLHQLVTICGISGSGKTSLAFDTLYAEGQRRYLETLSPAARQFIHQLPKPDADQITGIPPTIALKQNAGRRASTSKSREPTVGIESGIQSYLRLLFTLLGQVLCPNCQIPVTPQSPESVLAFIKTLPESTRFQIGFPLVPGSVNSTEKLLKELIQQGMTRAIIDQQTCKLDDPETQLPDAGPCLIVLDRLSTGKIDDQRILESVELAFEESAGSAVLLTADPPATQTPGTLFSVDQTDWHRFDFFNSLICSQCQQSFLSPEPQLFNFFSQSGTCPVCQGTGSDPQMGERVCPACLGSRLNPAALAVRVKGVNIHELGQQSIQDIASWLEALDAGPAFTSLIREISERLTTLEALGIGYLTLNRRRSTLSSGELQRIALTAVLSSNLVNTLYVLDEPSSGLHSADRQRVISVLRQLRDLNNSLVIVEHNAEFLRAADHIVELGPGAGKAGGELIFQGTFSELQQAADSPTSQFLKAPHSSEFQPLSGKPASGSISLSGCTHNNLQDLSVTFPLGQLCVVTGISGSGKSSLVEQTLFPSLVEELTADPASNPDACYESLTGADQIDEVVLLDQTLTGQTPRSIPATYLNLFDDIRSIFAQTADARLRNLTAKDFSFNSKNGGRCPECKGTGFIEIDLQFLADLTMVCQSCHGQRYQRELLEIKYRKLNIAEVLEMTVDEAFPFFRGQAALQKKLKQLKDVGLGYIPLGQPLPSLSGGECQRLKLAAYLTTSSRKRTLFLMNEPSRGLHPLNIQYLLNCFEYLLTAGHSLILIEHNLQLIQVADHIIDLGPGAGDQGGQIVVTGTPAEVAENSASLTGAALRQLVSGNESES
ncbi:excinuclease ABC subunit UvrA [Gimesia panareensis]|uniref:excinuclease ABC subunit UvrA n=1 Tax=Gimesia panareensis TaxID=2527978 RepID=UPI0011879ADB|nr:excinuclease ABC subunit UvrA [Gimesia panareensis]QDU50035.1 UvrABC system protein A [Gimesia panareensis]